MGDDSEATDHGQPADREAGGDVGGSGAAPPRPLVDVTPALHEAGHEEELLGTEDVADTAPLVRRPGEPDQVEEAEEEIRDAVFTHGQVVEDGIRRR